MTINITNKCNVLYEPQGQFNVGTTSINEILNYKDPYHAESCNYNLNNPNKMRETKLDIFYPSTKKKLTPVTSSLFNNTLIEKANKLSKYDRAARHNWIKDIKFNFGEIKSDIALNEFYSLFCHSHANLPLPKSTFPVVVFVHGFSMCAGDYTCYYEELASQGYCVVALNQFFISSLIYPDDGRDIRGKGEIQQERVFNTSYNDVISVLKLLEINKAKKNHKIYEIMDLNNIAVMGHSLGGAAILNTAQKQYPSLKACISLSEPANDNYSWNLAVPIPTIRVHESRWIANNPQAQLTPISLGENNYLLTFTDESRHLIFSDRALLTKVPIINALSKKNPSWYNVGTMNGGIANDIVIEYAVSFFNYHLKNIKSPAMHLLQNGEVLPKYQSHANLKTQTVFDTVETSDNEHFSCLNNCCIM